MQTELEQLKAKNAELVKQSQINKLNFIVEQNSNCSD